MHALRSTVAHTQTSTAREPAEEQLELSILMPCLDEENTIAGCVREARQFLGEHGIEGEVIVADNGSRDRSREIAQELGARVLHVAERGYGNALAAGIAAARGRFVIMGDSDGSYDFEELMPFLVRLRAGYELVMGNRFAGRIERGAMRPLHRYFGNPLLSAIGRRLFRSPCGDFYCGQRGFTREAARRLELHSAGMEFALEMLVKATLLRLRVTEIPVTLSPDGRGRRSHLCTWRDGWRSLRLFLLYSPRWLFLYPGLLLMLVGTSLATWLLPGARALGNVHLDVHTLLYCAASISVGFQLCVFFVFGKVLAETSGLHPRSEGTARMVRWLRLEIVLLAGLLLILCGLGGSLGATLHWADRSFGDLDPFEGMRIAIPSAYLMTLGLQVLCSSFYFSLLQLQWHERFTRARSQG